MLKLLELLAQRQVMALLQEKIDLLTAAAEELKDLYVRREGPSEEGEGPGRKGHEEKQLMEALLTMTEKCCRKQPVLLKWSLVILICFTLLLMQGLFMLCPRVRGLPVAACREKQ